MKTQLAYPSGNVAAVLDEDGLMVYVDKDGNIETASAADNVACRFEYDAYGNNIYPSDDWNKRTAMEKAWVIFPHHISTKEWDPEANLYYFGYRWYEPRQGAYVSRTPLSILEEETYGYCFNNPIAYVDFDGLNGKKQWFNPFQRTQNQRDLMEENEINPDDYFGKPKEFRDDTGCVIKDSTVTVAKEVALNYAGEKGAELAFFGAIGACKKFGRLYRSFNPFKSKTWEKIKDMLFKHGYVKRGVSHSDGKAAFFNPSTGRSVHYDPDPYNSHGGAHFDITRPRDYKGPPLDKKRFSSWA